MRVLESRVTHAETASEKVGLMQRIGQVAEDRLNNETSAINWYARALEHDATYLPALQALGKLHSRREEWEALIHMHLREAAKCKESSRRAAAHARVATLYEERLGDVKNAIDHHSRALGLDPKHARSFKALTRLFRQEGRLRELAEFVRTGYPNKLRIAIRRSPTFFKIGRLQEDSLDNPVAAVSAYKRVLEVVPGHLGGIHAWQRAAESALSVGKNSYRRSSSRSWAGPISDGKRSRCFIARVRISEDHLGDVDAAAARYKKVLAIEPQHAPALSSLGVLFLSCRPFFKISSRSTRVSLPMLKPLATKPTCFTRWGELCEERLADEVRAEEFYRKATKEDPTNPLALRALERKLAQRGGWPELVRLLEEESAIQTREIDKARDFALSGRGLREPPGRF